MPLVTTTSGRIFEADSGESLLAAAQRAGLSWPYSCKTGRCSSCKARVLEGTALAQEAELGLSAEERSAGWVLTCINSAQSNVMLDVEDLGQFELFPARTWPCRIHDLKKLSSDVIQVTLRLPPSAEFTFHPGQYIDILGPGGLRRSYSMANAKRDDRHIELHIRAVHQGAMSQYWFERAAVNDLLRLNGPLGTFFLRDIAGLDLACLATGTGMAPVKAMLEGLAHWPDIARPRSIAVYWGGRSRDDFYWDPSHLAVQHRYTPVLSRPDSEWSGALGHVHRAFLSDSPDLTQSIVFACGSAAMIADARRLLTQHGLPSNRFQSDAFVSSTTPSNDQD